MMKLLVGFGAQFSFMKHTNQRFPSSRRAEARTSHAHMLGLFLFNKDTQDWRAVSGGPS